MRLLDVNNTLILPYHINLQNLVTSSDVIHSWAIPSIGVKADAVPGRINQIFLFLNTPGVFFWAVLRNLRGKSHFYTN